MIRNKRVVSHSLGKDQNLIINLITGKNHILSDHELIVMNHPSDPALISHADSETRQKLLTERLIFENAETEKQFFLEKVESIKPSYINTEPLYAILPNFLCNFNCSYCSEPSETRKRNVVMSPEMMRQAIESMKVIDQHLRGPDAKITRVNLLGGEPLLPIHKSLFLEMLSALREEGMKAYLISNGYFLKEFVAILSQFQETIAGIQITIDGPKEVHNSRRVLLSGKGDTFDKIVEGVNAALGANLPVGIRVNVNENNLDSLDEFAIFARSNGWNKAGGPEIVPALVDNHTGTSEDHVMGRGMGQLLKKVWPLIKSADNPEGVYGVPNSMVFQNLDKFLAKSENLTYQIVQCDTTRHFAFAPDGLIYPCELVCGTEKYAIGRFYPEFELFPEMSPLWTGESRSIEKNENCQECSISVLCGGGCPLAAFVNRGDISKSVCDTTAKDVQSYLNILREHEQLTVNASVLKEETSKPK